MIIEGARYNGAPQLAMQAPRPYVDQLTGRDPRVSGDIERAKDYVGYGMGDARYQSRDYARFQSVSQQLETFQGAQQTGDRPLALSSVQSAIDGLNKLDRGPTLGEAITGWFRRGD